MDDLRSMYRAAGVPWDIIRGISGKQDAGQRLMAFDGEQLSAIRSFGLGRVLPSGVSVVPGPCSLSAASKRPLLSALRRLAHDGEARVLCSPAAGRLFDQPSDEPEGESGIEELASPLDCIRIAGEKPEQILLYYAAGNETLLPVIARLILIADEQDIENLAVYCDLRSEARLLFGLATENRLYADGFLVNGMIQAITGTGIFEECARLSGKPVVAAGFERTALLSGLINLSGMVGDGRNAFVNLYSRAVGREASRVVGELCGTVFLPCPADWQGIGEADGTGFGIRREYGRFDAALRFGLTFSGGEPAGPCRLGEVLTGACLPFDCPSRGTACTPETPLAGGMSPPDGACILHTK